MPIDSFQPETPGASPEDEIRELERKLEEKKRALASGGEAAPPEKEVFREVLRERVEDLRARAQSTASVPASDQTSQIGSGATDDQKKRTDDLKKEERRKEQIKALIELALKKTIEEAVRAAQRATPYLLDELHDHLVDDYYDKLVSLRKITPL
ncbi:MAG: hypothetical protein HY472_00500 [Candidatus Sungbacteria bacterium]|nr:hypothetical protein [Candidatus Sungbacteria bacterium]